MNFFEELEKVLAASHYLEKVEAFQILDDHFCSGQLRFGNETEPQPVGSPPYADFLTIVPPQEVNRRRSIGNLKNRATLLHGIVHIEYSAIDLALDAAYRFRDLPESYYADWMQVAREEVEHFLMLLSTLEEMGFQYGDFPVHAHLHEALQKTSDFATRMAVVPRFLEAGGLDANPVIMEKLDRVQDGWSKEVKKHLGVILEDEVGHVNKGDRWYRYALEKENLPESFFFDSIRKMYPQWHGKRPLNRAARIRAGYTEEEIERLESGDF